MSESDNAIEREQEVRKIAYHLWEKAGRPSGGEDEFWRQAEEEYERGARIASDKIPKGSEGNVFQAS